MKNYAQYAYPTPTAAAQPSWQTGYSTLSAALQVEPPVSRRETVSVPPRRVVARNPPAIDHTLAKDDWAALARVDPVGLLQHLVSALVAPNPVSRIGQPIEDAFRTHVGFLAPAGAGSPPNTFYASFRSFWLPTSPAYFSLMSSSTAAPTPPEYRFLYWDPQLLVLNGIACPHCAGPLLNRGCIRSGPIKVYDIGKPFFIIGCEYVCHSVVCKVAGAPDGRRLASTDAAIMRSLPRLLQEEFPAELFGLSIDAPWSWQAVGVSKTVWDMVRSGLGAGVGKDALLQIIRSTQEALPNMVGMHKVEDAHEGDGGELELEHPGSEEADGAPTHDADDGDVCLSSVVFIAYSLTWLACAVRNGLEGPRRCRRQPRQRATAATATTARGEHVHGSRRCQPAPGPADRRSTSVRLSPGCALHALSLWPLSHIRLPAT